MCYVYIVGPLFTEADRRQRLYEGEKLRNWLQKRGVEFTLINPIDLPFNDGPSASPQAIFEADYQHQCRADAVFLELASNDTGSMMALGILLEKKMNGSPIRLYPIFSDTRLKRNEAAGLDCPVGYNSFIVGGLRANEIPVFDSFETAFHQFTQDVERRLK